MFPRGKLIGPFEVGTETEPVLCGINKPVPDSVDFGGVWEAIGLGACAGDVALGAAVDGLNGDTGGKPGVRAVGLDKTGAGAVPERNVMDTLDLSSRPGNWTTTCQTPWAISVAVKDGPTGGIVTSRVSLSIGWNCRRA